MNTGSASLGKPDSHGQFTRQLGWKLNRKGKRVQHKFRLGCDRRDVRRIGFSIADSIEVNFDPKPYYPPQLVDWDELNLERNVSVFGQRHLLSVEAA